MTLKNTLPEHTLMGVVTLKVGDLNNMKNYYTTGVKLQIIAETKNTVLLGHESTGVLLLQEAKELKHAPQNSAGLFHTAILYTQPSMLAEAVYSILTKYPHSFTGAADHLVSRAFYFDDPEGNGLELYVDYPREQWTRVGEKGVQMATLALDVKQFLTLNLPEAQIEGHPLFMPQKFHVEQAHNIHEKQYETT